MYEMRAKGFRTTLTWRKAVRYHWVSCLTSPFVGFSFFKPAIFLFCFLGSRLKVSGRSCVLVGGRKVGYGKRSEGEKKKKKEKKNFVSVAVSFLSYPVPGSMSLLLPSLWFSPFKVCLCSLSLPLLSSPIPSRLYPLLLPFSLFLSVLL